MARKAARHHSGAAVTAASKSFLSINSRLVSSRALRHPAWASINKSINAGIHFIVFACSSLACLRFGGSGVDAFRRLGKVVEAVGNSRDR